MLQKQWTAVDYKRNMSIIGLLPTGKHKSIIAIGSYAQSEEKDDVAEVAFVVKEEFQGMGICSFLLNILENIAKENGYKAFVATVLGENRRMISIFQKRYPKAKIVEQYSGEIEITMEF
jgi:RimJ/RimL family protein N-acetyltransferase